MKENISIINKPLVSVVVPNYNYAAYLEQRLDSILDQTYKNLEVILLDDCSQDNSVAILSEYKNKDRRIKKLIVNTINSGSPFRQWALGLSYAQGKYVWIAECDDYADIMFVEHLVAILENHEDVSLAFSGSLVVDRNDNLLNQDFDKWTCQQINGTKGYKVLNGLQYASRNLFWSNRVYNASGCIFRKSVYDKIDDYRWRDCLYAGDWLFWFNLCLLGDVIEVYEKLNRFRRQAQSVTLNSVIDNSKNIKRFYESVFIIEYMTSKIRIPKLKQLKKFKAPYYIVKDSVFPVHTKKKLLNYLKKRTGFTYFRYTLLKPIIILLRYGRQEELYI